MRYQTALHPDNSTDKDLHLIYEARQSSLANFIRPFTTQPVIILTMTFTYSATVDKCGITKPSTKLRYTRII